MVIQILKCHIITVYYIHHSRKLFSLSLCSQKNVDGSLITERIIEEGVSSSDLYLGNNVVVNEICYTIVGYGNAHTRDYIATNRQR